MYQSRVRNLRLCTWKHTCLPHHGGLKSSSCLRQETWFDVRPTRPRAVGSRTSLSICPLGRGGAHGCFAAPGREGSGRCGGAPGGNAENDETLVTYPLRSRRSRRSPSRRRAGN